MVKNINTESVVTGMVLVGVHSFSVSSLLNYERKTGKKSTLKL